jgi:hypothetical protein
MDFNKQISKIIILTTVLLCVICITVEAQHKRVSQAKPLPPPRSAGSQQLALFTKVANQAGVDFTLPSGFKELPALNNEDFSFDYAMILPGQDFEVWFQIHSLKQNWASYEQVKNITGKTLANPDSTYIEAARAHASALSDGGKYFMRPLPPTVLDQYNASSGKTFLFDLADLPETASYKHAFLIAIQKDHVGYVMAVCLTNEKGPEFFKNISKARYCIKFR